MPKAIIGRALLAIGEALIGLVDFLEANCIASLRKAAFISASVAVRLTPSVS
jgi:hypothetical protein